ncbi:uncharacterized protein V6R79_015859 [Siganus canaliculatus]
MIVERRWNIIIPRCKKKKKKKTTTKVAANISGALSLTQTFLPPLLPADLKDNRRVACCYGLELDMTYDNFSF